jgi:hypothetical protein
MPVPVEPDRKVAPVLRICILLAIIVALFLILPPTPAMAWSSVPFLLLAALFFDAYRRGRRLLLARDTAATEDPLVEGTRWIGGLMLFHAVWTGIGSTGAMADGMPMHGMDAGMGADLGGIGGGIDACGIDAGGDGGMGGSF